MINYDYSSWPQGIKDCLRAWADVFIIYSDNFRGWPLDNSAYGYGRATHSPIEYFGQHAVLSLNIRGLDVIFVDNGLLLVRECRPFNISQKAKPFNISQKAEAVAFIMGYLHELDGFHHAVKTGDL